MLSHFSLKKLRGKRKSDIADLTLKYSFEEVIEDDQGYKEEFEDFYRGIRLGKKVRSSFFKGYKDLQVIMGAINSTSKWKNLELK